MNLTNEKPIQINSIKKGMIPGQQNILPTYIKESGSIMENKTENNKELLPIENKNENRNKNRCCVKECNKKLGLFGFECRCGVVTCAIHKCPSDHSCTFDYKQYARDKMIKENPITVPNKFTDKI